MLLTITNAFQIRSGYTFCMKPIFLVTAFLLSFGVFQAQGRNLSSMDGKTLLTNCHAAEKMDEVSPNLTKEEWSAGFYCLGFVQGTVDADNIWQTAETKASGSKAGQVLFYCLPSDVSWPQLVRVLVKWLENNPSKLNLPGYDVINMAISGSYPCKTSTP